MLLRSPRWEGDSLGPTIKRWMETRLVYGPGDLAGEPYKVDPFYEDCLWDIFALDERGRRVVRRALIGLPKGSAKTEFAGGLAVTCLAGPVLMVDGKPALRNDPDVVIAAASYEQADLIYSAARTMSEPVYEYLDGPYDHEIGLLDRAGKLYRVAAVQGANDGKRPTEVFADEVHEWLDNKGRVHLVLGNGLSKRAETLEFNITTAGHRLESVAGKLYEYGKKVASGEVVDASFMFRWAVGPDDVDLDDPVALRAAVSETYQMGWIDLERVAQRFEVDGIPPYEFARYYLNQWTSADVQWLPSGVWALRSKAHVVGADTPVVLGFDGSYSGDSTALIGCTVEETPHVFVIDVWENPGVAGWQVPRESVKAAVAASMKYFEVVGFWADPFGWGSEIGEWKQEYGDEVVHEFWTNQTKLMASACSTFYTAVTTDQMTHDGDPRLTRHIENAQTRETRDGVYIVKDGPTSPRKIDAAVAAVICLEKATAARFEDSGVAEPSAMWT